MYCTLFRTIIQSSNYVQKYQMRLELQNDLTKQQPLKRDSNTLTRKPT